MGGSVGSGVVDWHTHVVAPDLGAPDRDGGDYAWPVMERLDDTHATMWVGRRRYREVDDRCWSATRRIADMDAEGVAVQVVSPMPVTLCHDAPPAGVVEFARAQNTFFAALVGEAPDRFRALGAVPLQEVDAAVAELRRCVQDLGFVGVEVGARVGALELSDPAFGPFFDAADELGAVVFVHPVDEHLDPRLAAAGLAFGVGMPGETAVAGAGLLTAGTLVDRPNVRVCLAHGGGALPMILPRVAKGQAIAAPGRRPAADADTVLERAGVLWCDSLTYDTTSLRLVLDRVGEDHVVLGTDYPFAAREVPVGAVLRGLHPDLKALIGVVNGEALMTLTPATELESQ
ncbi:amidohydrolase family protein [Prauserella muralis]|uniref:2-amino-3-carboxymuconate-6-semialdehyde decarboxylase n=1 Tax=Prauserella muralis TaxID=588067 RepID=A0A2V4AET5_9PSEU|nr:amidohydrolase family protein [Prauserella muralis]PXY16517.1 aminocarboxymuconate-semialdehyde decarboxylase [Prauserella muralis]TWE11105.1 aminocarboxymuconate-semialdehyde decarboxylase [Prauserella muralis]